MICHGNENKKDTFKNVDTVVEHPSVHNSHDLQLW